MKEVPKINFKKSGTRKKYQNKFMKSLINLFIFTKTFRVSQIGCNLNLPKDQFISPIWKVLFSSNKIIKWSKKSLQHHTTTRKILETT